jgi:hypothetical protein
MTMVAPGAVVTAAMLDALPLVVRRYLDWPGVEGRAEYRTGAEPLKYVELHVEPHQTGSKAPADRRPDQRRWVRTDGGPR